MIYEQLLLYWSYQQAEKKRKKKQQRLSKTETFAKTDREENKRI